MYKKGVRCTKKAFAERSRSELLASATDYAQHLCPLGTSPFSQRKIVMVLKSTEWNMPRPAEVRRLVKLNYHPFNKKAQPLTKIVTS